MFPHFHSLPYDKFENTMSSSFDTMSSSFDTMSSSFQEIHMAKSLRIFSSFMMVGLRLNIKCFQRVTSMN